MALEDDYLAINKKAWNQKTQVHLESDFYNVKSFLAHKNSLNSIELDLLGNIQGKSILHLQCHFGQDSISLANLGAEVVGVDFSDKAIEAANNLAKQANSKAKFICSNVYDLPQKLNQKFDYVFTSYGVIGWLPDLKKWANTIDNFLKPKGQLVLVEFHPVVWMFDDDFKTISYNYFQSKAIVETEEGTYANPTAKIRNQNITWNHSLSQVFESLLSRGMQIKQFKEYDYSPYPCFSKMTKVAEKQYQIQHLQNKIPMVYALVAQKVN